jgi:hypothetical protein
MVEEAMNDHDRAVANGIGAAIVLVGALCFLAMIAT